MFCLGFILFWTVWISWTWVAISFHMLGTFSTIISSSIFSFPFFLSSSSGTPMTQMLECLTLSQRSQRLSSFLFTMCLGVFLLGFILPGTLWNFFSFWNPQNANVGTFNVVPEVSYVVFFLFHAFFPIFCSVAVISTILSSRSFIRSSASVILLLILSSVLFISVFSLVLLGLW